MNSFGVINENIMVLLNMVCLDTMTFQKKAKVFESLCELILNLGITPQYPKRLS
jgi:hypothetical protein